MTRDDILRTAKEKGLRCTDRLDALLRPAAVARIREGAAEPGASSQVGGLPWLPGPDAWPRHEGRPLSFIAQVLASDVPAPLAADLPSAGLLSFFYLDDGTAWGFDPKDRGKFAVRHFPDASALKKSAEWPEGVEPRFTEVPIRFEPTVTIPSFETLFREESSPPKEETRAYQDLEEALVAKEGIADQTRVLGHPHQVQGEMSTECALVREGIYCGDGKYPEHPRYEEISRKAGEWRLLLQVHSFEEAGMCWGDLGTLYFWIPDASLKARRFEDAWMVLQCS